MTIQTKHFIDLSDIVSVNAFGMTELQTLSCTCRKCGTEMVFKISTATYKSNKCPDCDDSLYPLSEILSGLKAIYQKVTDSKLDIRLGGAPKSPGASPASDASLPSQ